MDVRSRPRERSHLRYKQSRQGRADQRTRATNQVQSATHGREVLWAKELQQTRGEEGDVRARERAIEDREDEE